MDSVPLVFKHAVAQGHLHGQGSVMLGGAPVPSALPKAGPVALNEGKALLSAPPQSRKEG